MTSAIATTNTERAPARIDARTRKFLDLRTFLTSKKDQVATIAGRALDTERVLKIVLDAAASNEKLLACAPESLLRAMLYCARVGLEPVGAWGVWLVPYGSQVTPIIDYRAMVGLVKKGGDVRTISAHPVYEHDTFDVSFGDDESIAHKPELDSTKRGKMIAVYAIATLKDGQRQRVVLTKADVDRYRSKSKASNSGPWVTDYEAMALKTAIKRLCNLLPVPMETAQLLDEEEREQGFEPTLSVEGDATPATGDDAPAQLPAQASAPATKADALKAELAARRAAQPAIDTTTTDAGAPESAPPSSNPPEAQQQAPASPAKDSPPAFTADDMTRLRAELTAQQAKLVELVGKQKADGAWNGSGPYAVGNLRGVRSHEAAQAKRNAASALVRLAEIEFDLVSGFRELANAVGAETADTLTKEISPVLTTKTFDRDLERAEEALDVLHGLLDTHGSREPGSDG